MPRGSFYPLGQKRCAQQRRFLFGIRPSGRIGGGPIGGGGGGGGGHIGGGPGRLSVTRRQTRSKCRSSR